MRYAVLLVLLALSSLVWANEDLFKSRSEADIAYQAGRDEEAMAAEVARRMGKRTDVEEEELEIPEELRNHEALAGEIARVRDLLQGLDDVEDFDLIQELSDDLYHLYKAVDYKIKLHHSSEAKAELGKLFKM